jgi:hypothetical protein
MFVLTYHAFTTPPILLNKLIRRYYAVERLTTMDSETKKQIHNVRSLFLETTAFSLQRKRH